MGILFYRQTLGQDQLRSYFNGGGWAQFQMTPYATSYGTVWGLNGSIACPPGGPAMTLVSSDGTAWDPVLRIGSAPGSSPWQWIGLGHGYEKGISRYISVDGVDVSNAGADWSTPGDVIVHTQFSHILSPANGTTVIGVIRRVHTLSDGKLKVRTTIMPNPGQWQWFSLMGGMMPVHNISGASGFNRVKFDATEYVIESPTPAVRKGVGSHPNVIEAYHTGHIFSLRATFPNGAPSGSWTDGEPDNAYLSDGASGGISASKVYIADIGIDWTNKIPAYHRELAVDYEIVKN